MTESTDAVAGAGMSSTQRAEIMHSAVLPHEGMEVEELIYRAQSGGDVGVPHDLPTIVNSVCRGVNSTRQRT